VEADARLRILAKLGADAQRELVVDGDGTFDPPAISPALVVLAELVAVDGIVEEEGEVAEQAPVVVLEVGGEAPVVGLVAEGEDLPLGRAAQRGVERAVL